MRKTLLVCSIMVAVGSMPAWAQTTYLYDGFDYPVGSLADNSGGAWFPGWGTVNVTSPGLSYSGLSDIGNKASTGAGGGVFHMMPAGFDALNSTVWIGVVAQADAATGAGWSGVSPFLGDAETLFLGNPGQDIVNGARYWGVHLYNPLGDPGVPTGPQLSPLSVDNQVLAVTRIVNGDASAQLTLWINPALGSEPSVGDALFDATVGRIPFDRIRIAGAEDGVVNYDELRVGDSFFAVVPEPASVVLMAVGGLLLARRRRR